MKSIEISLYLLMPVAVLIEGPTPYLFDSNESSTIPGIFTFSALNDMILCPSGKPSGILPGTGILTWNLLTGAVPYLPMLAEKSLMLNAIRPLGS